MKVPKRDLMWYEGNCFVHRVKNHFVEVGEKPYWQYWVWRITGKCQPNDLIGATESLKRAKELFNKYKT